MWNYYRDEPNSDTDDNEIKHSIINSKTFGYKANFIGSVTHNNSTKNDVKFVAPSKYLSNIWRSLNMGLINCEVELILTWFKNCVLISKSTRDDNYNGPIDRKINTPENAIFQITNKMFQLLLYQKKMTQKRLEQIKSGFKKTIKWNKYRSQMTFQPQNNNSNYLIDPTFTNVNILFVLSFQRIAGEDNTTKDYRDYFSHYYVPNIRIKDFNVLIDGKSFF